MAGYMSLPWVTWVSPRRTMTLGLRFRISAPSNSMVPDHTGRRPETAFSRVDLPVPLPPSRATMRPAGTVMSIPRRICTLPYPVRRSRMVSTGILASGWLSGHATFPAPAPGGTLRSGPCGQGRRAEDTIAASCRTTGLARLRRSGGLGLRGGRGGAGNGDGRPSIEARPVGGRVKEAREAGGVGDAGFAGQVHPPAGRTGSAPSSTLARCHASRPAPSAIWRRQLVPPATIRVSRSAARTAGSRPSSPIAIDVS